jgi:hypothetical protein
VRPNWLRWQWEGYPEFHRAKVNLWIHLVAVPWFSFSAFGVVASLLAGQWMIAGASLLSMGAAFGQGFGHNREDEPAIPFSGVGDAFARIFAEQFITCPRFVLSGAGARR